MGPRDKEYVEKLRRLIEGGMSVQKVADQFGVSYQTIRYYVHKYGIQYVPDSGRNRKTPPNLAEMVAEGMTTGAIAKRCGVGYKMVWKWIRKLNIPYHRSWAGGNNPSWKGGRRKAGNYFYVWCPDHPFATSNGGVLEHRLVMELKLGRYLLPGEVVHHERGYSNAPENLYLFASNAEHLAVTLKGKIPKWTPAGRRRILASVRRPRGPRKKPSPE